MAKRLEYPLLSCKSLAQLLRRNPTTVLLCIAEQEVESRIPGSVYISTSLLSDSDLFLARVPESAQCDDSAVIVCYEYEGLENAATAWWLLVSKGCRLVSVLEGGLKRWHEKGDPRLGCPIGEAMSPRTKGKAEWTVANELEPCRKSQNVTTDENDECTSNRVYVDPKLLLNGADFIEAKQLRWALSNCGVRLEQDCETVAFGPNAPLLLLALCSLGKNRIRLGVEFQANISLYDVKEDATNARTRKVSNLNSEPVNSTRASVITDAFAESVPEFPLKQTRDSIIGIPAARQPPIKTTDPAGARVCQCHII